MNTAVFYLRPTPPFRLDLTVWALRRMPHNLIDRWDGRSYQRVLVIGDDLVKLDIHQPDRHRITVKATSPSRRPDRRVLVPFIEKLLGIRTDLAAFQKFASNTEFAGLANAFTGFKPPRFPTLYEAMINAIACQQISLTVCIVLLNRLTEAWGRPWTEEGSTARAFPLPRDLALATLPRIRALGFSSSKARTILAVSQEIASGRLDLAPLEEKSDAEVLEALTRLPGIGPWSAEYVMLRGLGRTHIFPGSDSGALRSLQLLLHLGERPDPARVSQIISRWRPFGGLVYFHFLLNKLRSRGLMRLAEKNLDADERRKTG